MLERRSRLSRPQLVGFGLFTTLSVLALANGLVELLERRGIINTLRPGDFVQHVDDELFERDLGRWEKTSYARRTMVRGGFTLVRGEAAERVFLLGGSFMMGSPFADPTTGEEQPGTPATWLRAYAATVAPDRSLEVVNLGAMGQDSHRVRQLVDLSLERDPTVLIVATCNNEAWLPEGLVRDRLRQFGGYRMLDAVLRPAPDAPPRIALPSADVGALRTAYEANLRAMARASDARGVPLLLATVPVNLRYDGLERESSWTGVDAERADCLQRGIAQAESGEDEVAERILGECRDSREARLWLALMAIRNRRTPDPTGRAELGEELSECITTGIELHYRGQQSAAIEALRTCDNVHEALRWIGLAELAAGQFDAARRTLLASVDLFPRNRCRTEFNEITRRVAASEPGVHLLDLAAAVNEGAADGVPGRDLFVDVCHMNRTGYSLVGRAMWRELAALRGLGPSGIPAPAPATVGAAQGIPLP